MPANFILVFPFDVSCGGEGYAILNYDFMFFRIPSIVWDEGRYTREKKFPFAFVWHVFILSSLGPMQIQFFT